MSEFLSKIDDELRIDFIELKSDIDLLIRKGNELLDEINEEISLFLGNEIESKNMFGYGRKAKEILESVKFSLKLSDTTGDANKYINALMLYSYILSKGDINIVALDTYHTAEVTPKNLNKVLKHIQRTIGDKQYLVVVFDDRIDNHEFEDEIISYIGPGKESLLGYKI